MISMPSVPTLSEITHFCNPTTVATKLGSLCYKGLVVCYSGIKLIFDNLMCMMSLSRCTSEIGLSKTDPNMELSGILSASHNSRTPSPRRVVDFLHQQRQRNLAIPNKIRNQWLNISGLPNKPDLKTVLALSYTTSRAMLMRIEYELKKKLAILHNTEEPTVPDYLSIDSEYHVPRNSELGITATLREPITYARPIECIDILQDSINALKQEVNRLLPIDSSESIELYANIADWENIFSISSCVIEINKLQELNHTVSSELIKLSLAFSSLCSSPINCQFDSSSLPLLLVRAHLRKLISEFLNNQQQIIWNQFLKSLGDFIAHCTTAPDLYQKPLEAELSPRDIFYDIINLHTENRLMSCYKKLILEFHCYDDSSLVASCIPSTLFMHAENNNACNKQSHQKITDLYKQLYSLYQENKGDSSLRGYISYIVEHVMKPSSDDFNSMKQETLDIADTTDISLCDYSEFQDMMPV